MDPEPLFRILADDRFENPVKERSIGFHFLPETAIMDDFERVPDD